MTRKEHITQREAVLASEMRDAKRDRKNVYRLSERRPCAMCGAPKSFVFCDRCDRPSAA